METVVLNSTAILISWTIPVSVHNQDLESVVVNVQSECFTGVTVMQPRIYSFLNNNTESSVIVPELGTYIKIKL